MKHLFFNPPKEGIVQFGEPPGLMYVDRDQHKLLVDTEASCELCYGTPNGISLAPRRVTILAKINDRPNWETIVISLSLFKKIQELAKLAVDKSNEYQYNRYIELSFGVNNEWLRWRGR